MVKLKKTYLIATLAITAIIVVAGTATVHAATTSDASIPMSNLVNAIATKFNLNANEVQKVFDEQKTQMDIQCQNKFGQKSAEQLAQAVAKGKLTQDQANKITAKRTELESQEKSLAGKTDAERKAVMKTNMDSLKKWASDNNIPMQYIMMHRGMGFGGHDKIFNGKGPGKKTYLNSSSTVNN